MKTYKDYLKEKGTDALFLRDSMGRNYSVYLKIKGDKIQIQVANITGMDTIRDIVYATLVDTEYEVMDYLSETLGFEVRICEQCGSLMIQGYTAGNGEWYCCEDCFDDTMDNDYGKGKWRTTDEEGENGGYYEYLNDNEDWEDTGIYYTEWY